MNRSKPWLHVQKHGDPFETEPEAFGWWAEIRQPIPFGWRTVSFARFGTWDDALRFGLQRLSEMAR